MGCGCSGNKNSTRRNTVVPRIAANLRRMTQISAQRRENVINAMAASQPEPNTALDAKRKEIERKRREQILRRFGRG